VNEKHTPPIILLSFTTERRAMSLTEEKFTELSQILDEISKMEDTLYTKALRGTALLEAMIGLMSKVNFLGAEVYKMDSGNAYIQNRINLIYGEIAPLLTENKDVKEYPPYIENSKQRIEEIRAYLEGKRGKR
jgi:hypothetical protein